MSVYPELYKFPHEINTFHIPNHGTPELVNYVLSLQLNDGTSVIQRGMANLPDADVNIIMPYMENKNDMQARASLTINRLTNRICEKCGDKSDIRCLMICKDCCLSWYCSKRCQESDWERHMLRCCRPGGPLDTGYQGIAIMEIDK